MNNYIENYIKEFQKIPTFEELYLYMQYQNHKKNNLNNKVENYNPNHDDSTGRFSSGGGSSSYKDTVFTDNEFQAWAQGQIKPEKDIKFTLERYQGTEAYLTNESLKKTHGKISDHKKLAYEVDTAEAKDRIGLKRQKDIIDMDNSMVHRLDGDTYLYRGLSHVDTIGMEKGDFVDNYGFASTTFKHDMAVKHTSNAMKRGGDTSREIVLKIKAPKGTKGLVPTTVTGTRSGEQEFILPRGGTFKVTKNTPDQKMDSGKRYEPDFKYDLVEVTYVPK